MSAGELPYFDRLLSAIDAGVPARESSAVHGDVHWGYFEDPASQPGLEDYHEAAHQMTRLVCDLAGVASGQLIADIGCGLGGTLRHIGSSFEDCGLVGVNIDDRQLRIAADLLAGATRNELVLLAANACATPLASHRFDVVLAVECIFHFPSRREFLKEAARLLLPTGRLVITDFVLDRAAAKAQRDVVGRLAAALHPFFGRLSGGPSSRWHYERFATAAGLQLQDVVDVTANTLPTYRILRALCRSQGWDEGDISMAALEELSTRGIVRYEILTFTVGTVRRDA